MKKITDEEYYEEAGNYDKAGYLCWFGGFESCNGKMVLAVKEEYYLFEQDEVAGPEYQSMVEQINAEADYYLKIV